jgi:Protein of unknown function (DUF1552)
MKLSRRSVLRGAAGISLFLPRLESLAQAGQAPKRIVFVFTANGDQISQRFTSRGESTFVLGDMLSPFERHRKQVLLLDGINKYHEKLPSAEVSDSHQQGGSALAPWRSGPGSFPIGGSCDANGQNCQYIGYVKGPSIDKAIGDRLLAENPGLSQRHLVFRVGDTQNNIWNLHSHAGPAGAQNPINPETNPFTAYTRIFQGIDTAGQQNLARRLAMKRSALDLLNGELNSLKPKISAADRVRLEQHTQSLRDIERQLSATTGGHQSCSALTLGTAFETQDPTRCSEVGQLFFKIIAMSFACDLARSVNFNWSGNTSDRAYTNLGIGEGHHTASHFSDASAFTKIRAIKKYLFEQSTKLHDELMMLPENGKTVFDNTLVVHWSELSQGDTHQRDQDLVVLAGGGGYFRTGRMLDLKSVAKRSFSNLLVSCWNYMGYSDVVEWGDPLLMPGGSGPLENLV